MGLPYSTLILSKFLKNFVKGPFVFTTTMSLSFFMKSLRFWPNSSSVPYTLFLINRHVGVGTLRAITQHQISPHQMHMVESRRTAWLRELSFPGLILDTPDLSQAQWLIPFDDISK